MFDLAKSNSNVQIFGHEQFPNIWNMFTSETVGELIAISVLLFQTVGKRSLRYLTGLLLVIILAGKRKSRCRQTYDFWTNNCV